MGILSRLFIFSSTALAEQVLMFLCFFNGHSDTRWVQPGKEKQSNELKFLELEVVDYIVRTLEQRETRMDGKGTNKLEELRIMVHRLYHMDRTKRTRTTHLPCMLKMQKKKNYVLLLDCLLIVILFQ